MSINKTSLLEEIREAVAKKQSETGERNAVVRVLARHGAYSMPKIETGRFGKGATIRVYIWDTTWGSLVLSSGPSVEGEVQYADKRSVSDAPDGYYHMLEKATGTSKITSAMKKIASRQDVTGSTTVSKPKRKKAAPKRKAAPKKPPSWSVSDYMPFPVKSITILWHEGTNEFEGKVFKTWSAFQKALEKIGPKTSGGYTKVKFDIKWDGIMRGDFGEKEAFEPSWMERLDLSTGAGDFNPNTQYIGNYLKEASQGPGVYGNLRGVARHEVDDLDWGKAAPKRKAKAPEEIPKAEIVFVAKTRGGKYRIEAEYDAKASQGTSHPPISNRRDTYTIRRYTSGRQTGGNVGIRHMRDLQIELGKLVGGAAIDGINYKVESWGRTFDITEFELVRDRTEGAFTQEVAIAEELPSAWTEPEEPATFEEEIEVMSTQDTIIAAINAAVAGMGAPEGNDVPY